MRVEPEERVSFATHRGLLCSNEQQRVRAASWTPSNSSRSNGLDWKIRVAFASQIRLDKINNKRYKVQENKGERIFRHVLIYLRISISHWRCNMILWIEVKILSWNIPFLIYFMKLCNQWYTLLYDRYSFSFILLY